MATKLEEKESVDRECFFYLSEDARPHEINPYSDDNLTTSFVKERVEVELSLLDKHNILYYQAFICSIEKFFNLGFDPWEVINIAYGLNCRRFNVPKVVQAIQKKNIKELDSGFYSKQRQEDIALKRMEEELVGLSKKHRVLKAKITRSLNKQGSSDNNKEILELQNQIKQLETKEKNLNEDIEERKKSLQSHDKKIILQELDDIRNKMIAFFNELCKEWNRNMASGNLPSFEIPVNKGSLTSILKLPDVKQKFSETFPSPKLSIKGNLKAPPLTQNYSLVGTAFDYLLRFYLEKATNEAITKEWIAEESLKRLEEQNRHKEIKKIILAARKEHKKYLTTGELSDQLLKTTLLLAKVDLFYRIGKLDENLEKIDPKDIQDLRNLINLVDLKQFQARSVCLLNPCFNENKNITVSSDADIVIDSKLIDIKTIKQLQLEERTYHQLIGYYILSQINGFNGSKKPLSIKQLSIYFSRYGKLVNFPIPLVRKTNKFIKWFTSRFSSKVTTRVPLEISRTKHPNFINQLKWYHLTRFTGIKDEATSSLLQKVFQFSPEKRAKLLNESHFLEFLRLRFLNSSTIGFSTVDSFFDQRVISRDYNIIRENNQWVLLVSEEIVKGYLPPSSLEGEFNLEDDVSDWVDDISDSFQDSA